MFEKVIVVKTLGNYNEYCREHNLDPRKQIFVLPDDVYRVAGLELSEDQVVIVDQPCEELRLRLNAMTREKKE